MTVDVNVVEIETNIHLFILIKYSLIIWNGLKSQAN